MVQFGARAGEMKTLIMAALAVTVLAGLTFLAIYPADLTGLTNPHPGVRAASRHLIATTVLVVVDGVCFLLLGAGVLSAEWPFALVFWAGAGVMIHRNVLVIRARRSKVTTHA